MIKVLITGGSGFIGTHLTALLKGEGYQVEHIGRSRNSKAGVKTWLWNPGKNKIEDGVFDLEGYEGFYLVHLAGEGIIDKAWTAERKKSLVSSRADTISFLYDECSRRNIFPKALVSAGGISWYGMTTSDKIFEETDLPSSDFIGQCCVEWEKAVRQFEKHGPVSILRTPLVIDRHEGGLPQIDRKIFGLRPMVGTGRQWMPWIHIHDLCRAYVYALENSLSGSYNAVAPTHLTYRQLVEALNGAGKDRKGFFIPLKVPAWAIRCLYGERQALVTQGSRASGQKLLDTGYTFQFPGIGEALRDLYR